MEKPQEPPDQPFEDIPWARKYPELSISAVWRGSLPLWQAFWFLWVVGGALVALLSDVVSRLVWIVSLGHVEITIIVGPFLVFCWVAVWRSAFKVRRKIWGYVARGLVVANVVATIVVIVRAIMSDA